MFIVEVVMRMKMIEVGPFDNRRQALHWACDLIDANPDEKAIIAVNQASRDRIRIFIGETEDLTQEDPSSEGFGLKLLT